MPLIFGTPTYKATFLAVDFFGNPFPHTVELVAASPALAVTNAQRLCNQFNRVTGAKITGLMVTGHCGVLGDSTAGYGDWREYQAWVYAKLGNSKDTTIKIPGPTADLLLTSDKRFINPNSLTLALFLARFKAPGNIARLRYSTLSQANSSIIRHVDSVKGKKIKIG